MHTEPQIEWSETDWEADKPDLWQLYKYRTQYSPLPLVVTEGPQHIVRYANPAFCTLAKKEPKELKGIPFSVAIPEGEGNECLALLDRVFATRITESIFDQIHTQNSEPHYWGYSVWAVLEEEDCPPGVMIQVTDTSEAARTRQRGTEVGEALILLSIKQHEFAQTAEVVRHRLELAMRETEHRAKNSLHTISSRLSLQLRANPETVPSLELSKLQMHIKTIAAMHDLLTFIKNDTETANSTSVKEMLQKLLPMWQTIVGTGHFEWSCDELQMSIMECTSLATIINELVCNAVKHRSQTVILRLTRTGNLVTLEVSDDGEGFPKDFNIDESTSFGLKFVKSVSCSELKGKITYENLLEGGACVKITFPLAERSDTPVDLLLLQ